MDLGLLWRSAALQAGLVALIFVLLVLAPLPAEFFREYGVLTGPTTWVICSAATGRILRLGAATTVLAALVSGILAAVLGVLLTHTVGLVIAVLAFGAVCGLRGRSVA